MSYPKLTILGECEYTETYEPDEKYKPAFGAIDRDFSPYMDKNITYPNYTISFRTKITVYACHNVKIVETMCKITHENTCRIIRRILQVDPHENMSLYRFFHGMRQYTEDAVGVVTYRDAVGTVYTTHDACQTRYFLDEYNFQTVEVTCTICMEDTEKKTYCMHCTDQPCGKSHHAYHRECIEKYIDLGAPYECPSCRMDLGGLQSA